VVSNPVSRCAAASALSRGWAGLTCSGQHDSPPSRFRSDHRRLHEKFHDPPVRHAQPDGAACCIRIPLPRPAPPPRGLRRTGVSLSPSAVIFQLEESSAKRRSGLVRSR
jgi:hypothetical protein